MKLSKEINIGDRFPVGYGYSYSRWDAPVHVCYPIPLNWLIAWARDFYFTMIYGPNPSLEIYEEGHLAGFDAGLKVGREQLEDLMRTIGWK